MEQSTTVSNKLTNESILTLGQLFVHFRITTVAAKNPFIQVVVVVVVVAGLELWS